MANIKISDLEISELVNISVGDIYKQLNKDISNESLLSSFSGSKTNLNIKLDTIYYDYNEIVQDIAYNLILSFNNRRFSGPVMDAAYTIHNQIREQNDYNNSSTYSIKSHDISLYGIAVTLEKAVGYHYVMGMLMKYVRDEDLSNSEWEAISNFLYNREKKPYQWDAKAMVFRIQTK